MTLDQKITAEIDAAKAIKAAAAAQNRDMTDEETTQMVAHLDAADALKAEQATADEEAARAESVAQARADAASRLARADADLNKPKPRRVPPAPAVAREGFLSDPKRGFAHMGDLAIAIHGHGNVAAEAAHDARLRSLAAATGLNQTVGAEGGFADRRKSHDRLHPLLHFAARHAGLKLRHRRGGGGAVVLQAATSTVRAASAATGAKRRACDISFMAVISPTGAR